MNIIEFKSFTETLAGIFTGEGVFVISFILAVIFFVIYYTYHKSRQLLNSLPGLFTSLGLLGTFVAICNSLGDINQDTLEIDTIIRELIPAFESSIAGLIGAFVVTVVCKVIYSKENKKLDKKIDKKTPDECLFVLTQQNQENNQILSSILNQLVEQDAKNKEYNDRLNTTIGQQSEILERFVNDFVKRMDDIFTKMHGQIEQNIKDFGEEQFKKCAETIEALTEKMSLLSSGLLEEQKLNVKQMIEGTNTELQSVSCTVTEQMNLLCSQMNSALSVLRSSQDERLTAIVANYDALSERLANQNSDFAKKMNDQMIAEYEKIQAQSVNGLQQMVDLKDAYAEVNQEMLQSNNAMNREVCAELRNSLTSFVDNLKNSITEEVNLLSNAIKTSVHELENSYSYISDHVANIKGNYESAAQAYQDAVINAHRMNESQENVLSAIDDSMKHVIKTNEKVDEVITAIEERYERIENLISHINEIGSTIEILQKLESQLNKIVNR